VVKHARGNGDCRFQRAGTSTRTAVTTAGEHEFTLHHVKDTAAATGGNPTYFRPLEDLIDFDGQRIYQEDISLQAAELATSLSYRDAVAHGDGFTPMPSITTVNRRVREYGSKLGDFVRDRLLGRMQTLSFLTERSVIASRITAPTMMSTSPSGRRPRVTTQKPHS